MGSEEQTNLVDASSVSIKQYFHAVINDLARLGLGELMLMRLNGRPQKWLCNVGTIPCRER